MLCGAVVSRCASDQGCDEQLGDGVAIDPGVYTGGMPAKPPIALGLKVRTGRAIVVALTGSVDAPEVAHKTQIDLATTFAEGAVYHAAQTLELRQARSMLARAQSRFLERARAALQDVARGLTGKLVAVAMVAPEPQSLPPLEKILKAHPLVHAAEIELYRNVFGQAASALGMPPIRIPEAALAPRAASALGITEAKLTIQLKALGKLAGKPWAAHQKQAAMAAWIALEQHARA